MNDILINRTQRVFSSVERFKKLSKAPSDKTAIIAFTTILDRIALRFECKCTETRNGYFPVDFLSFCQACFDLNDLFGYELIEQPAIETLKASEGEPVNAVEIVTSMFDFELELIRNLSDMYE